MTTAGTVKRETTRDKILAEMEAYWITHHNCPTYAYLADKIGVSTTRVGECLERLMWEGRLDRVDGDWRIPESKWEPPPPL